MSKEKISKREFIEAYQWMYDTSRKEAEYIWNISTYEYKQVIVSGYISNCKKSFYD